MKRFQLTWAKILQTASEKSAAQYLQTLSEEHGRPWSGLLVLAAACAVFASLPVQAGEARPVESDEAMLARILRPDRTDQAVLSPDGRHLAFSVNLEDGQWAVQIRDLDNPAAPGWTSPPFNPAPRSGSGENGFNKRQTPFGLGGSFYGRKAVTFLRWTNSDQLVYATSEALLVVRADGSNWRKLFDTRALDNPRKEALTIIPDGTNEDSVVITTYPPDTQFLAGLRSSRFKRVSLTTGKITNIGQPDLYAGVLYDRSAVPRVAITAGLLSQPIPNVAVSMIDKNGVTKSTAMSQWSLGSGLAGIAKNARDADTVWTTTSREVGTQAFWIREAGRAGASPSGRSYRDMNKLTSTAGQFSFRIDWTDYYGPQSLPLAFGRDPNVLYFASNKLSDTFGIYGLDLTTNQRTSLKVEIPGRDLVNFGDAFTEDVFVFDHAFNLAGIRGAAGNGGTLWLDPDLTRIQSQVEGLLPDRTVELIGWDNAKRRILAKIGTDSAPGSFIVVDASSGKLVTLIPCAPWIPPDGLNPVRRIQFESAPGVQLQGTLTDTATSKLEKKPLIIYLHDIPQQHTRFGYNRDVQALAALGFVVMEFDYRGSSGHGNTFRNAVRQDFDRIPLEDLKAALDYAAGLPGVSRTDIALLGEGFGGYVALRALEEMPNRFSAAITYNAPTNPNLWTHRDPWEFAFSAVPSKQRRFFQTGATLPVARSTGKPVLMLFAGGEGQVYLTDEAKPLTASQGDSRIIVRGTAKFPASWTWEDWQQAYITMNEFLNVSMYNYGTSIGELKVLK